MKIKFDHSSQRYYVFYDNRLVWFDNYDQAEDWIQLNHLEDEE
jgi:hypothetical protein